MIVAAAFPLSTGILVLVRGRWFKTLLWVKPALQKHNLENRSLEQFENQWGEHCKVPFDSEKHRVVDF